MDSQTYLEQIFKHICGSAYVMNNPIYHEYASNTQIAANSSYEVNAYAMSIPDTNKSKIVVYDGLITAVCLVGAILADHADNKNLALLRARLKSVADKLAHASEPSDISDIIASFGIDVSNPILLDRMETYTYYGVAAVVAHELGHIVLGHCTAGDWTEVISRNNERQADLFACQIIEVFPAKSYGIYANLFVEVLLLWMSPTNYQPTTHPHSKERVYNMYDSHDVYFKAFGLEREYLDLFLPSPDEYEIIDGIAIAV